MTTDEIIEVSGPNDWTMELSFEGLRVQFRWRELFYQGRSFDFWAKLVDPATGEDIRFDGADHWKEQAIRDTVATFRVAQLRNELKLGQSIPFMTDREFRKSLILELFERSERGEYLGQRGTHQFFFVQDVAAIFATEMVRVLELVDELSAEGKIGLNGMILIPNEDQEAAFASWEKSTGHRRITVGDFGNWGCQFCGQAGDEYDNPKDFPCVAPPAPKAPAIALSSAEPKIIEGVPTGDCSCICHHVAGISHIRACCDGTQAVAKPIDLSQHTQGELDPFKISPDSPKEQP